MMISYVRSDYDSASQWLEALRQDDAWLSQLQQLKNATAEELSKHHQMANKRIEEGAARDFWYFYKHQVEKVVEELWETNELTLPKLKTQTIWMLTVEWLEREQKPVIDNRKEIVAKLSPIFFNDESEASSFLSEIQDMKPLHIQVVLVHISVLTFRTRPFRGKQTGFGTVKPLPVIIDQFPF